MGYDLQTKSGYDFYEVASLLQKSLRRGDIVMAARAVNELTPQYANYAWNRMMTVSAEDCADMVTTEVVALYDAWEKINTGKREKSRGRVFFAKAIILLAKARHARDADELNILVSDRLPDDEFRAAMNSVDEEFAVKSADFKIPSYVYDVHTWRGKRAGATKKKFLIDEAAALANRTSIFDNLDEMIESPRYVAPQGELF